MRKSILILGFVSLAGLTACMDTPDLRRAAAGAAIGCLAGEVLRDGECVTGAAVGGLAGALADDI